DLRIRAVATAPFMLGRAKSITTTLGCSLATCWTASWPSLASPTIEIPGSSSSIRRNPRRTRWWSSTSNTEMSDTCVRLLRDDRHGQPHNCAAAFAGNQFEPPMYQLGALAHRNQSHAAGVLGFAEADAVVFHFQHD